MSTNINLGIQAQSFMYREEARAKYFNKLVNDLLPTGIYKGGNLLVSSDLEVIVPPLICLIKPGNIGIDNSLDVSVRVETTLNQNISLARWDNPSVLDTTRPYLVLRYDWSDEENNYMDIKPVGFSDDPAEEREEYIKPNDLILGKVLMIEDGGGFKIDPVQATAFDYSRQHNSALLNTDDLHKELVVSSSEVASNKVYVSGGYLNTSFGRVSVLGGNFPASGITATTSLGRIDLVYVTELGEVKILEGEPLLTPLAPEYQNKKVIAEIRRGANRSTVEGYDIFPVRVGDRAGMLVALSTLNPQPESENIEDAFQQLGETVYDAMIGSANPDWIKDFHIDWGIEADQVSAIDIPVEDALGILTGTNLESALAETKNLLDATKLAYDTHAATHPDTLEVHGMTLLTEIPL